jgi:hypothetical protein
VQVIRSINLNMQGTEPTRPYRFLGGSARGEQADPTPTILQKWRASDRGSPMRLGERRSGWESGEAGRKGRIRGSEAGRQSVNEYVGQLQFEPIFLISNDPKLSPNNSRFMD